MAEKHEQGKKEFEPVNKSGLGGVLEKSAQRNITKEQVLEKSQDVHKTVDAYKQLGKYLEKMNDGFIVYTNAKDYSLVKDKGNGGYFFQGFSAGSAISLRALEGVISNTPGGSAEIIG